MADERTGGGSIRPEWAVSRLQVLPGHLFKQAVLHLLGDGAVGGFADFILCHEDRGPLQDCGRETLRRYLTALRMRLQEWRRNPKLETAPSWLKLVLDEVNSNSGGDSPASRPEFDHATILAVLAERADALTVLKLSAIILLQEQEVLMDIESRHGVFLSKATDIARTILKIADEMRKIELLEAFPRLKLSEGRRVLHETCNSFGNIKSR